MAEYFIRRTSPSQEISQSFPDVISLPKMENNIIRAERFNITYRNTPENWELEYYFLRDDSSRGSVIEKVLAYIQGTEY